MLAVHSINVICIIVDEAHCVYIWSAFRPEYNEVGRIRDILPKDMPILMTSATPKHILNEIHDILRTCTSNLAFF
ncbi:hypothetical protein BDQ17DRAFT_1257859 [Cyathus striatus]|nr:hypothetical protein BDQ17DRAFT_1257859 [Cyathus striatus]